LVVAVLDFQDALERGLAGGDPLEMPEVLELLGAWSEKLADGSVEVSVR
jgi:hypothetical protein